MAGEAALGVVRRREGRARPSTGLHSKERHWTYIKEWRMDVHLYVLS